MTDFNQIQRDLRDIKAMSVSQARRASGRQVPAHLTLIRATACRLRAFIGKTTVEDVVASAYRNDRDIQAAIENPSRFVARAVTGPAATTVPEWAGVLVETGIFVGVLASISPASVYAQLSARGLRLSSAAPVRLPSRAIVGGAVPSPFVGEGQAIPVRSLQLDAGPTLTPKKAACISHYTKEMIEQSTPSVEQLVATNLAEDIRAGIDGVLLSASPPSGTSPGGILNGVTAIPGTDNLVNDIAALASSFVPPAASLVLICNTTTATKIALTVMNASMLDLIVSDQVLDGSIIAVDASDFASSAGDGAQIDVVDDATIVARTDPFTDISDSSGPVTSLWQMAMTAARVIEFVAWVMRRSGRVAVIEGATW